MFMFKCQPAAGGKFFELVLRISLFKNNFYKMFLPQPAAGEIFLSFFHTWTVNQVEKHFLKTVMEKRQYFFSPQPQQTNQKKRVQICTRKHNFEVQTNVYSFEYKSVLENNSAPNDILYNNNR